MPTLPQIGIGIAITLAIVPVAHAQQQLTTIDEVLAAKITVSVPELDELVRTAASIESKVRQTYDVGFEFKIRVDGDALREHGITRNARVRPFSQRGKSVADVLTALAVKMNPITTVRSLTDPDQQMVWVVAKDKQSILITVRKSAQARSLELPSVFREKRKE